MKISNGNGPPATSLIIKGYIALVEKIIYKRFWFRCWKNRSLTAKCIVIYNNIAKRIMAVEQDMKQ